MDQSMASILIVDDSRPIRSLLRFLLQDAGFTTFEASGGKEALEAYRRIPVDLLMVDAHMPEWDGPATIREFRRQFPQSTARIILMTGDPTMLPPDIAGEHCRGVAHRILAKPFHPAAALAQIREELHAREAVSSVGYRVSSAARHDMETPQSPLPFE